MLSQPEKRKAPSDTKGAFYCFKFRGVFVRQGRGPLPARWRVANSLHLSASSYTLRVKLWPARWSVTPLPLCSPLLGRGAGAVHGRDEVSASGEAVEMLRQAQHDRLSARTFAPCNS